MSENGEGAGRQVVMRASVAISIAGVVVTALGLLGGWGGSFLTSDRQQVQQQTQTIEQLKAKNERQDDRHDAAVALLKSQIEALKSLYDARFETVVQESRESAKRAAEEAAKVARTLDQIGKDLGVLTSDVRVLTERQGRVDQQSAPHRR